MVEKIVSKVLQWMQGKELRDLKEALYSVLSDYDISEKSTELQKIDRSWEEELGTFLVRKKVEGRSERTIELYSLHLRRMLKYLNKPVNEITESDLFLYISMYREKRHVSGAYLDNIRLVFSSFFSWLNAKGYISKNPAAGLDPIKTEKRIKKPLSDTELEKLRRKCRLERDLALIECLYSTGVRVSELIALNRKDINFDSMDMVVYGKGAKERETYLTAASCMHLQEYLDGRIDDNEALFVSLKAPYDRLQIGGIEARLRNLGEKLDLCKVHPHKFRRTLATMAIDKGMPIEQLQQLLGHRRIDTTLQYAMVKQSNVKIAHRKYIG